MIEKFLDRIFGEVTVANIMADFSAKVKELEDHAEKSAIKMSFHSAQSLFHANEVIRHKDQRTQALSVADKIRALMS